MRLKFDSVAKLPECPDHSHSADSLGLFAHRGASLLIANAFMQLSLASHHSPMSASVSSAGGSDSVSDLRKSSKVMLLSIK
jgi:hypothetical protein